MVINPCYPPADDDGLYDWFAFLCRHVSIGIWLFDTRFAGVSLSLPLIDRLADIENVCGIKVGRDHQRYLEVLGQVGRAVSLPGSWLAADGLVWPPLSQVPASELAALAADLDTAGLRGVARSA